MNEFFPLVDLLKKFLKSQLMLKLMQYCESYAALLHVGSISKKTNQNHPPTEWEGGFPLWDPFVHRLLRQGALRHAPRRRQLTDLHTSYRRSRKRRSCTPGDSRSRHSACSQRSTLRSYGTAKRRYGLDRIMSKLDETSKTEAGFAILMMNAWKRVYGELLRSFLRFLFPGEDVMPQLFYFPVFQ